FFSTARTMARFGLMILAEGEWQDEVIMEDKEYFNQMITPSQDLNPAYGYLWWLNGQERIMVPGSRRTFNQTLCPPAPADMVAAMGKNSQLLNVVPSEGLVVVRMGESPSNALVSYDLQDGIWGYLNHIICIPSNQREQTNNSFKLFPNPVVSGKVNFENLLTGGPGDWMLYDISGRLVFQTKCTEDKARIDLPSYLENGLYVYLFQSKAGHSLKGRLVLQR
ncbi:MAG TPA: T9SS type A sorting domain-containing protein, partial [Saprospiraceae bacterium]|nr:T9SS type A sorting domain-containing protein [Saprospiraceae bacterium]